MHGRNIVLLVDDDADDRQLFGEALQQIDQAIELIEAFDGINALEKMNDGTLARPDIIFLDLNMPRMDGKQLLQLIKKMEAFHNTPVVMYSTSSRPADINFSMENGAAEYITKHCSFELLCKDLQQTLHKHLNKRP